MELSSYLDSLSRGDVSKFATKIGVSVSFLSQMASGYTKIPAHRALAIETETSGLVTRRDLLPNDWHKYWRMDELDYTDRQRQEGEQP